MYCTKQPIISFVIKLLLLHFKMATSTEFNFTLECEMFKIDDLWEFQFQKAESTAMGVLRWVNFRFGGNVKICQQIWNICIVFWGNCFTRIGLFAIGKSLKIGLLYKEKSPGSIWPKWFQFQVLSLKIGIDQYLVLHDHCFRICLRNS